MLLSACASRVYTPPPPPPRITLNGHFDRAQAQRMLEPGTNSLRGSALIRQQGGGVVSCAGQTVTLLPVSDIAREWSGHLFGSTSGGYQNAYVVAAKNFTNTEWSSLAKTALCDAQGNFRFERVADGEFYVFTSITWTVGYRLQGGMLMKLVKLDGATMADLVLAP
jgi:hypothetical protein